METDSKIRQRIKDNSIVLISAAILFFIVLTITIVSTIVNNNDDVSTSNNNAQLSSQLETEQSQIADAVNQRFSFLKDKYDIHRIVLLDNGYYATALLTLNSTTYRTLLIKNDGIWSVEGLPSVVLFYDDYADIPRDIIKLINDLEVY